MAYVINSISLLGFTLLAVNGAHCSSIGELRGLQATRDNFTCGDSYNSACSAQCNGDMSQNGLVFITLFGDCNTILSNNTFNVYILGEGALQFCNSGMSCDTCLTAAILNNVIPSGDDNSTNMCCSQASGSGPGGDGDDQSKNAAYVCSTSSNNCSGCTGTGSCNCGCYGKCNTVINQDSSK